MWHGPVVVVVTDGWSVVLDTDARLRESRVQVGSGGKWERRLVAGTAAFGGRLPLMAERPPASGFGPGLWRAPFPNYRADILQGGATEGLPAPMVWLYFLSTR